MQEVAIISHQSWKKWHHTGKKIPPEQFPLHMLAVAAILQTASLHNIDCHIVLQFKWQLKTHSFDPSLFKLIQPCPTTIFGLQSVLHLQWIPTCAPCPPCPCPTLSDNNFLLSVSCLSLLLRWVPAPDLILPPDPSGSDKPEKPIWRGELISKYT